MGKKAGHKATKKFAKSGQLKKTIQARHKQKQVKKRVDRKRATQAARDSKHAAKTINGEEDVEDDDDEDEEKTKAGKSKAKKFAGMSVDDFLGGGFMDEPSEDDGISEGEEDEDDEEDEEDDDDEEGSFGSLDDLEDDDGQKHKLELSKLAEKDPEFYKYLQENDNELLDFDPDAEEDLDEDADMEDGDRIPTLTKEDLNKWQKALLEKSSLRALRKLLIAFRSAVHMDDSDEDAAKSRTWLIDDPSVHTKLITTALRYTPVVLQQHIPYKTLANGKFKPPTQNAKQKALSKLILSYFYNVLTLLGQSGDLELQTLALSESAKIIPYVMTSRKAIKTYLKTCLELWSTAADDVRIAAFLAVRHLASSTDSAILDLLLKNSYLTLVRSCKHTTGFTLPSINLMKSTAAELYCSDHAASYQHAFRYIRQLAIHLRTSLKTKTKESYKQVYNWQYAHCIDFWAIVLSRACDMEADGKSELKALIYPLVQVALGSTKLISNARSYPFHLQIVRSLLRITQQTRTYIPLAPYLVPIVQSVLSPTSKHKASALRALDLELNLHAPSQYISTRIYSEVLMEETVLLLAEWLTSRQLQCSIAFPEIVAPLVTVLRKSVKASKGGKEAGLVKGLIEHAEEGAKWLTERRKNVKFGPGNREEVAKWESAIKLDDTPMGKWIRVLRKQRVKRKELLAKAREGEAEILSE